MNFEKTNILGIYALPKLREQYPQLTQALLDLDIAEVDAVSEGGGGVRRQNIMIF